MIKVRITTYLLTFFFFSDDNDNIQTSANIYVGIANGHSGLIITFVCIFSFGMIEKATKGNTSIILDKDELRHASRSYRGFV